MKERRHSARFKSSTILQYKEGFFKAHVDTVTKDLSLGGVCFFSDKKLAPGRVLKLKLFNDIKKPPKIVKGKVIWSSDFGEGSLKGYLNGIVFI